jgi:hypothetical protein
MRTEYIHHKRGRRLCRILVRSTIQDSAVVHTLHYAEDLFLFPVQYSNKYRSVVR